MRYFFKRCIFIVTIIASTLFSSGYAAGNYFHSPILVLATNENFGSYTGEILRAEGFNEFEMLALSDKRVNIKYLREFDIIILAEKISSSSQAVMLDRYVKEGGNLVSVMPDKSMEEVFGLNEADSSFSHGYILVSDGTSFGTGLTNQTMQVHVPIDKCTIHGSRKIASLYSDASTATQFPTVVMNDYGKGHAIGFLYNLPENIVYTRQGNYQYAGMEMDGINGIRAMDMFTNGWVDTSKNTINQADEQMRLLSRCIETMSGYTKPLPRFWYFPDTLQCLVTLTNDGEYRTETDFRQQFLDIESRRANMALYILLTDKISKNYTDALTKKGHEVSGHVDDTNEAAHPEWASMNAALEKKLRELKERFGIPNMRTIVNHWFVWCGTRANGSTDFAAQARLEAEHGIGMDINYAHYDNHSTQGHFLGPLGKNQGNFTGSGLVMKFADTYGEILNIYQALNNVYDQQYMENKDSVGFYECFKGLVDRSLYNEVYSFISIKSHNDEYFFSKTPLLKMLDYANEKMVPVWTPAKLLDFLRMKEEAIFANIKYSDNHLSFQIKSSHELGSGLTCMIPYLHNGKKVNKISVNKTDYSYIVRSIKGLRYALLTVKPGAIYSISIGFD